MNFIKNRLPVCLFVLAVYAVTYLTAVYALGETGYIAFITWMTVLLCLLVSLVSALLEHKIAGIISAVAYPIGVIAGHLFGRVDAETGEYSGWRICYVVFFALSAAAVFYFRVKKVKRLEAERAKAKDRE